MSAFADFTRRKLAAPLVVTAVFALAGVLSFILDPAIERARPDSFLQQEMVYFPSGAFLDEVSGGQSEIIADYLWLRAIQYYGMHRQTDRQYLWAKHIFDVITALNPLFVEAFRFGGLVLATDALDADGGIDLLKRGFHANPSRWEIPFDIGFVNYLVRRDLLAAAYFRRAAALPGAGEQVERFAAFAYRRGGSEGNAREMWREIQATSTNPVTHEIAQYALDDIDLEEALRHVQSAADAYRAARGASPRSPHDLVASGFLRALPPDPFGRGYVIDPKSGRALSVFKTAERVSQTVATVRKTVLQYRQERGAYPASLDSLTTQGFMTQIVLPEGFSLLYTPSTGGVGLYVPPLFAGIVSDS
ncbi:MAG: hypothetical protein ACKVU1_00270 [bacterium]